MNNRPVWKYLLLPGAVLLAGLAVACTGRGADAQQPAHQKTQKMQGPAARAVAVSPDREMLAFVLERRNGTEYNAGLRAFLKFPRGSSNLAFPLTFEIVEVVQSPDPSIIAFIAKEVSGTYDAYSVYMFDKSGALPRPSSRSYSGSSHPLLGSMRHARNLKPVKSGLQFSDDGRFLRYVAQPVETEAASTDRLTAESNRRLSQWQAQYGYASIQERGVHGVSVGSIKWLPPKPPDNLPAFMTAAQPEIHPETQPAWSSDSKTLYVHDSDGVWSAEISRSIGLPEWRLMAPAKDIRAFHISADGSRALLERGGKTRRIELVNIKGNQKPQLVGGGRNARFSPDGKRFAFLKGGGAFTADIQDGKPRPVGRSVSGQPKIQSNSRLQWSHDSRLLYVHDAKGIWSMEPDKKENRWELYVKAKGLDTYRIVSWERRLRYVEKTPELPEFKTYIYLRAEAEHVPAIFAADGKGGFVPASPTPKKTESSRGAPSDADENGGMKERYLISVNLSNKYPQMRYNRTAWESGTARGKDSNRTWSYRVDSEGLHAQTSSGPSVNFWSFKYDQ